MKSVMLFLVFNYFFAAFASPRIMFDVRPNETQCAFMNSNDLGVCALNQTGEIIDGKKMMITLASYAERSGYAVDWLRNFEWKPGTFLNLHTSRERLKQGDVINHEPNLTGEVSLDHADGVYSREFKDCTVVWSYQTPPYTTPNVLIFEKVDGEYGCRYQTP